MDALNGKEGFATARLKTYNTDRNNPNKPKVRPLHHTHALHHGRRPPSPRGGRCAQNAIFKTGGWYHRPRSITCVHKFHIGHRGRIARLGLTHRSFAVMCDGARAWRTRPRRSRFV